MPVDSICLAQNLITGNRTSNKNVNFKGSAPDLEALRQMSRQVIKELSVK